MKTNNSRCADSLQYFGSPAPPPHALLIRFFRAIRAIRYCGNVFNRCSLQPKDIRPTNILHRVIQAPLSLQLDQAHRDEPPQAALAKTRVAARCPAAVPYGSRLAPAESAGGAGGSIGTPRATAAGGCKSVSWVTGAWQREASYIAFSSGAPSSALA